LDYDIIVMIVLSILHNSNKITLNTKMWVLPLETINCGYLLAPFLDVCFHFCPINAYCTNQLS
jgi:hypothetical protein